MKSIWKQDVILKSNTGLEHDTSVNTVVIGAGMAGILTAYYLQKKGIEVIILEAGRIAGGQTQNTTAKITSQHGLFYSRMKGKIGKRKLRVYAKANEEAVRKFETIIKEEKIDCDFEVLPAILYSTAKENVKILKREAKIAREMGINAYFCANDRITELPFRVEGAVCFENQAQFHPLKFVKHLAGKLTIYENTPVISVKGHTLYTNRGKVEADHIVFATHYPFLNLPGCYFLREHQERSYVLGLKGTKQLSAMYYSMDRDGLSFRSYKDILLLGGGNHRTGKTVECKEGKYGYSFLRKMQEKYYPNAETEAAWSAQDCMPHDDIPFIGKYSFMRPYWYVASGFKKWGMTGSLIAAEIISGMIAEASFESPVGKENKEIKLYASVFSPQRIFVRASIKNFMIDVWESISGLTKGFFCAPQRRCTHMGCRLEWNSEEKSWDCPCHGSRFSNEGELRDNPAQTDLPI